MIPLASFVSSHEPEIISGNKHDSLGPVPYLERLSIVVPVGPGDDSWQVLLESLSELPESAEVWLIGIQAEPVEFSRSRERIGCQMKWIVAPKGRARQMNAGARLSQGEFLWFLHADSQFTSDALVALNASLATASDSVHYFDLSYQTDGPAAARLNAWGVWLRSHLLKLPFGDQGLCMNRATFERLRGFPEDALYGEDHLLVWQAHRQRVPLRAVGATLSTSARKYRDQGWLKTTALHVWRTWKQAFPQLIALLWSRVR